MHSRDVLLPAELLEYDEREDEGVEDALQLRVNVERQSGAGARVQREPAGVLRTREDGLALRC